MKRTALKRKRKRSDHDAEASARWYRAVLYDRRGRRRRCASCGRPARHAHHILRQRVIEDEARALGYDAQEVLWRVDDDGVAPNGVALCETCHSRQHHAVTRIPRKLLPPRVWLFAASLGERMVVRLEREYPNGEESYGLRGTEL